MHRLTTRSVTNSSSRDVTKKVIRKIVTDQSEIGLR
jgi:hypothetical protein